MVKQVTSNEILVISQRQRKDIIYNCFPSCDVIDSKCAHLLLAHDESRVGIQLHPSLLPLLEHETRAKIAQKVALLETTIVGHRKGAHGVTVETPRTTSRFLNRKARE